LAIPATITVSDHEDVTAPASLEPDAAKIPLLSDAAIAEMEELPGAALLDTDWGKNAFSVVAIAVLSRHFAITQDTGETLVEDRLAKWKLLLRKRLRFGA
jgi:hypothetical protein